VSELSTSVQRGPIWPGVWRDYFRFIRNPRLCERAEPLGRAAFAGVGWLVLLILLMASILLGSFSAIEALGVHFPEPSIDIDSRLLQVLAITLIPALEEVLFRGWLTGNRLAITAAAAAVLLIVLGPAAARFGVWGVVALLALWLALAGLIFSRPQQRVVEWLQPVFPAAFWTSTALFAGAHLMNYGIHAPPVAILLILPQFIGGTILGYARVRYGMWANITIHASLNAAVVLVHTAFGI